MSQWDARLPDQYPGRWCEHCGTDQDSALPNHDVECPRYDGPPPTSWIPCSERMPDEREMVLFVTRRKKHYGDGGYEEPAVECGNRHVIGESGSWSVAYDMYYGDSWPDGDVTHWMPLPDPPP